MPPLGICKIGGSCLTFSCATSLGSDFADDINKADSKLKSYKSFNDFLQKEAGGGVGDGNDESNDDAAAKKKNNDDTFFSSRRDVIDGNVTDADMEELVVMMRPYFVETRLSEIKPVPATEQEIHSFFKAFGAQLRNMSNEGDRQALVLSFLKSMETQHQTLGFLHQPTLQEFLTSSYTYDDGQALSRRRAGVSKNGLFSMNAKLGKSKGNLPGACADITFFGITSSYGIYLGQDISLLSAATKVLDATKKGKQYVAKVTAVAKVFDILISIDEFALVGKSFSFSFSLKSRFTLPVIGKYDVSLFSLPAIQIPAPKAMARAGEKLLDYLPNATCEQSTEEEKASSSGPCFPGTALVQLENGQTITMDALQVGDKVLVGPNTYSEVFLFSHAYRDALTTFVRLQTASGTLQISAKHYLYVNGLVATADSVKVGDLLETGHAQPAAVTGISTGHATGLYNPHTLHGDIVVNSVRTTTYTDAIHPVLAHAMLAPLRAMYAMNLTLA